MRKLIIMAIIMSVMIPNVYSQGKERKIAFSANCGISSPTGPADFTRYWESGLSYKIGVAYKASEIFHFGLSARMDNFPLNETKIQQEAVNQAATTLYDHRDISIFTLGLFAKVSLFDFREPLKPYLFIQISESWPNTGFVFASDSNSHWIFARPMQKDKLNSFGFGLGSDYRISEKLSLTLEFGYREIFTYYKVPVKKTYLPQEPITWEKGKNSNHIFASFGVRYSINVF